MKFSRSSMCLAMCVATTHLCLMNYDTKVLSKKFYYSTALIVFRIITVIDTFFRLRRYVFSANRRSSNHLIDAPNGRIDQMTPWHFFRFLAARYALPPKIEKNA